jgi:D-glycero-D-manno-heptose 1,7-bisphosphate phosphatase
MKRAVFLDRDGVLNRTLLINGIPKPPNTVDNVEILEGVKEAIQVLRRHGYVPVVVTNQPDVARGHATRIQVEAINNYIGTVTDIEYFYTCFHDDADRCDCRKPLPGLLLQAAKDLNLDTNRSFMVGDRWRDISAGLTAGCKVFFIDYLYLERYPEKPFTKVSSLIEAAHLIVGEEYETK